MKKFLPLLVLLMLMPLFAAAEDAVQYDAILSRDTYLVEEPGGRSIIQLPDREQVEVLSLGEEWSRIVYDREVGYCKTGYLYHFVSRDPFSYPVPDRQRVTGFASFNVATEIKAGKFNGLHFRDRRNFARAPHLPHYVG